MVNDMNEPKQWNEPLTVIRGIPQTLAPKEETKSQRVNFMMYPTAYSEGQWFCEKNGITLNGLMNELLRSWIAGQKEIEDPEDAKRREKYLDEEREKRMKQEMAKFEKKHHNYF